jgi:hypothetical protein
MNIEQATAVLDGMVDKACYYPNRENDALDMAIEALREKAERENPKPLTLEELKERVGKPVWIQKEHYGEYKVFKKHHDSLNKYGKRYWFTDKEILFECHYGETWLAYDYEPKGAHK